MAQTGGTGPSPSTDPADQLIASKILSEKVDLSTERYHSPKNRMPVRDAFAGDDLAKILKALSQSQDVQTKVALIDIRLVCVAGER